MVSEITNLRWRTFKPKNGKIGEWLGRLVCKEIKKDLWEVRQDWSDPCRLSIPSRNIELAYGSELLSDGPSIPTLVCMLFGKGREDFLRSGFLHDSIYDSAGAFVREPGGEWAWTKLDKESADTILRIGCRAEGAKRWQEDLIYWGVRTIFGRMRWDECRKHGSSDGLKTVGNGPETKTRRKR